MKLKYTPDEIWKPFYAGNWHTAILIGGRGAGKTFNAGNFTTLQHHNNYDYKTLLLRDVGLSISQSILQNIKDRFEFINERANGYYSNIFQIQAQGIKRVSKDPTVEPEPAVIVKGFRKSRVEQSADLKGFEGIDLAIIEEAEDVRDRRRVSSLLDTLREEDHKVIIILNTPDIEHWVIQKYFTIEKSDYEEFYNIIPKEVDGVLSLFVTYKDNPHLPIQTVKQYDSYNHPTHPNYDPDYYAGSILGLARATRQGLVFKPSDYEIVTDLPAFEITEACYGLDFGYNHPTCLTFNVMQDKQLWTDTIVYESMLDPEQLANRLEQVILDKRITIVADSARPEIITYLQTKGFIVIASQKGAGSVEDGITRLKSCKWRVKGKICDELSKYSWKLDRDSKALEVPIDAHNHAIDSVRYALEQLYHSYNLDSLVII